MIIGDMMLTPFPLLSWDAGVSEAEEVAEKEGGMAMNWLACKLSLVEEGGGDVVRCAVLPWVWCCFMTQRKKRRTVAVQSEVLKKTREEEIFRSCGLMSR